MVAELTTFEGSPFQTLTTRLKKKIFGFVSFIAFPNCFVTVVSCVVSTVHCEIGVWIYISITFEDFKNCN